MYMCLCKTWLNMPHYQETLRTCHNIEAVISPGQPIRGQYWQGHVISIDQSEASPPRAAHFISGPQVVVSIQRPEPGSASIIQGVPNKLFTIQGVPNKLFIIQGVPKKLFFIQGVPDKLFIIQGVPDKLTCKLRLGKPQNPDDIPLYTVSELVFGDLTIAHPRLLVKDGDEEC